MEPPALSAAPPEFPELPEGAERAPRWPAMFAVYGFLVGFTGTQVLVGVGAAIFGVGSDTQSPGFVVLGTIIQGIVFACTAVVFASFVSPPRPWHFGLRRTRFWRASTADSLACGRSGNSTCSRP